MISSIWSQIGVFVFYGEWLTGFSLYILAVPGEDRLVSVGEAPNSLLPQLSQRPKDDISDRGFFVLGHEPQDRRCDELGIAFFEFRHRSLVSIVSALVFTSSTKYLRENGPGPPFMRHLPKLAAQPENLASPDLPKARSTLAKEKNQA